MREVSELLSGARFRLFFIRDVETNVARVLTDLRNDKDAKRAFALIQHVADNGPPTNEQLCRSIATFRGLFELKAGRIRIPFYYRPNLQIVLTHVFFKGKRDQAEYRYADQLRRQAEGAS